MKINLNLMQCLLVSIILTTTIFSQEGWVHQTSGTNCNLYSVSFGDAITGCAVGSCLIGNTLLNTTNGGLVWVANSYSGLSSVQLIDEYIGWAVGGDYYGGKIRKTTNGGLTWASQLSLENDYFASVYFLDETVGYASGIHIDLDTYGIVFKTTNGGEDWFRKLSLYGSEILRSVYFVNPDLGWVAGQYGKISKTTDGGSNWTAQNVDDSYDLRSIFFIDENKGWAVGNLNWPVLALHTTNGGSNWYFITQDSVSFNYLYDVYFIDSNNGWIVGANGKIFNTTDAGTNWIVQNSGTALDLHSVDFIDQYTGWVVGSDGTILKTTNSGVTFIEEKEIKSAPTDFSLNQNYPNPFNPVTSIQYVVGSLQIVTIKVYDVLGNEVATLVNEQKPAGTYEVEFNTASHSGKVRNLMSGIYFFQLKAGSFVETKKMLLLK